MLSEAETFPESTQEDPFDQDFEDELVPQEERKPRVEIPAADQKFLQEKLSRFICCGRCSLFLAAYRLKHDDAELFAAVNRIENGWLTLPWDPGLRELINKSYGCRIDVEAYYFESCCPECHSAFVYAESAEDQTLQFRIKI